MGNFIRHIHTHTHPYTHPYTHPPKRNPPTHLPIHPPTHPTPTHTHPPTHTHAHTYIHICLCLYIFRYHYVFIFEHFLSFITYPWFCLSRHIHSSIMARARSLNQYVRKQTIMSSSVTFAVSTFVHMSFCDHHGRRHVDFRHFLASNFKNRSPKCQKS